MRSRSCGGDSVSRLDRLECRVAGRRSGATRAGLQARPRRHGSDSRSSEPPKYPSAAMRAKIQGIVEVEAVVLTDGTVGDVRVIKSLDITFGLDAQAIAAAKRWQFKPGTYNGQPVPVIVTLLLEFKSIRSSRARPQMTRFWPEPTGFTLRAW